MAVIGAAICLLGPCSQALAAPQTSAGTLAEDANAIRSTVGARPLTACVDLDQIAQTWAEHEATTRTLAHNPVLATQMQNWSGLAENVGEGTTASGIAVAFDHSPVHLANLVDPSYSEAGFGAAESGGVLYVDEVFRQPMGGSCTPDSLSAVAPVMTAPVPVVASQEASRSMTQRAELTRQTAAAEAAAQAEARARAAAAARAHAAAEARARAIKLGVVRESDRLAVDSEASATRSLDVIAAAVAFHATLAGSLS